jgi:spore coat protein H
VKKRKELIVILLTSITIFTSACDFKKLSEGSDKSSNTDPVTPVDFRVAENKDIYRNDIINIEKVYITVSDKNKKYSLADINNYRFDRTDKYRELPNIEVRFNAGEPPSLLEPLTSNAVMLPRGHGSSTSVQKSIKIKLNENLVTWNGEKTLNLNKHPGDLTRIRNKLSFDYLKLIPDLFSFKTRFVQLFIRDLGSNNKEFVDYGLFTHIEQPNKQYLNVHGIAEEAYMYKAEYFEFLRYADSIKNVDDPSYNKNAFQDILEISGVEDHKRLIEMLDAVNDESKNINDIIDKYFDRENYVTWMAFNMITGNYDTNSQNFILVSPVTASKWYFIPWDYDGAWGLDRQPGREGRLSPWQVGGVSNYWGVVLHRRFLKDENNRKALSEKIEKLSKIINKETTEKLVSSYYDITSKLVKSVPDVKYLTSTVDNYENEIKKLPGITEENKQRYYEGLEKPMPVFLGTPKKQDNGYKFNWDSSYDFQGDTIYYDFKISTDYEFKNVIVEKSNLESTDTIVEGLAPGRYFWKVGIRDSKGNHQVPFDYYTNINGYKYHGMKSLDVE